jgi:hypothetical protein
VSTDNAPAAAPLPFLGITPGPDEVLALVVAGGGSRRGAPYAGAAAVLARADGSCRVAHRFRGALHDESWELTVDTSQELAYLLAGLGRAMGRARRFALEHDPARGLALLRAVEARFGPRSN